MKAEKCSKGKILVISEFDPITKNYRLISLYARHYTNNEFYVLFNSPNEYLQNMQGVHHCCSYCSHLQLRKMSLRKVKLLAQDFTTGR